MPARKKDSPVILSPIASDRLTELWLQGHSLGFMADVMGREFAGEKISRAAVGYWIDTKLRPIARQQLTRHLGEFLQEVSRLKAWAYAKRDECSLGLTEETVELEAPKAAKPGKPEDPPPPIENDPAVLQAAVRRRKKSEPQRPPEQERELVAIRKTLKRVPNLTAGGFVAIIQWCLEQEAKVAGHFAKSNVIDVNHSFRVGGQNPNVVDAVMMARVQEITNRIREDRAAVAALGSQN